MDDNPITPGLFRLIVVADAAFGWLALLGSLFVWFILGQLNAALIVGALAAVTGVAGKLLATVLRNQMPTSLNVESESAFERYFAEQARKEEMVRTNSGPVLTGVIAVAVCVVAGITLGEGSSPFAAVPLFVLWAIAVYALVVYSASVDDILADLPGQPRKASTDREQTPWQ